MDEDYNMVYGIDKLAELLIERGIEFFVKDEFSLAFKDDVGSWHECWMAGAEENLVNVMIVVTPEQALSVPDLNGIISENAKLRELLAYTVEVADDYYHCAGVKDDLDAIKEEMRELGIEAK